MADKKKSEQIKLYAVIGLAVFAGIVAYFRFFHNKAPAIPSGIPGMASSSLFSDLVVPKIDFGAIAKNKISESADSILKQIDIRDVFSMADLPAKDVEEKPKEVPIPSFNLSGTILGGGSSIAIIDNKFLRKGDRVSGFQVMSVAKNEVLLRNGDQEIVLKVLKNTQ
jgi:hypothetical protein